VLGGAASSDVRVGYRREDLGEVTTCKVLGSIFR
jgi:hypothetical protein